MGYKKNPHRSDNSAELFVYNLHWSLAMCEEIMSSIYSTAACVVIDIKY